MKTDFSLKALTLVFLALFLQACAAGSLFGKRDVSPPVDDSLEEDVRERPVPSPSSERSARIDRLLDAIEKQHLLMLQSSVENARYFEFLAEVIRESHIDACRELKKFRCPPAPQPVARTEPDAGSTDKLLIGEIEKVRLTPPGHAFNARVDTGATTSSLDARDIETFERDGNAWVRFKIAGPDDDALAEVEKEVVRRVIILQAGRTERERRPVVRLQIQLGRIKMESDFTLVDRQHLDYQVLIGRNILRDLMVVDVSQKFIVPLPES
jgi:hypothetical protein